MLEHVPSWLGSLLKNVRAGHAKLAIADPEVWSGGPHIALSSPAFADGSRLPERFTADGEGISPPLVWSGVPEGTVSLVLIAEDPDAPAAHPLVHAIVWNLPPDAGRLGEGDLSNDAPLAQGGEVGRNSFYNTQWLAPDPPTGHGDHDYVFQLFALAIALDLDEGAGRTKLIAAIRGHVLAAGMLVGTYSRGTPQEIASSPLIAPA